jgi:hypothetical protein
VAVADLNGDGKPDLVVGNNCSDANCDGSVGVLLGNGDGTFQPVATYPTGGSFAFAIAVADVNGDGKPDVLVLTYVKSVNVNSVGVLLGNGDGTFQPAVTYNSGGLFPSSVAVADLNGDGNPDLVVENGQCCGTGVATVGVLLGDGNGIFQPVVTYKSGRGTNGTSIAVADVNGDGKLDIVASTSSVDNNGANKGLVSLRLGNGDGTFQSEQTYSSGGFLTNSVAIADVNGDGEPDLVVANICADDTVFCKRSSVGVLLNNTSSCTTPPVITLSTSTTSLWPPNGKMVPVTVSGTISDTGCTVKTAAYAITDEYGEVQPKGPVTLGPGGAYSFTVLLQASRLGTDRNGRLYTITVSASNNAGKTSSQAGHVIVPHDKRHRTPASALAKIPR